MKIAKKLLNRKVFTCFVILIAVSVFLTITFFLNSDSQKFQRLSKDFLYSELTGNTLNLHYTLAYPENYGFDISPILPSSFSDEGTVNQILLWQDRLSEINPNHLNAQEQYTYTLFSSFLDTAYMGTDFAYYHEPMSPSSGMISGIPILLADYTFRNIVDVENYLELLNQTDTYFDGLIVYEQEKSAAGLFMSKEAANKVIEECYSIMDTTLLASGDHFLQQTFKERLSELEHSGKISSEQAEQWIAENDRLLTTVMAPAYERVADAFLILEDTGANSMGLFYFPKGKEYYQYLLRSTTGSSRSIEEIKKMLEMDFQTNWNSMKNLLAKHPDILAATKDDLTFPFGSGEAPPSDVLTLSEAMLNDLQDKMTTDFPALSLAAKNNAIDYKIKEVSSSMENFSSPAYYLTPPIDDMCHNTIYINRKTITDDLALYTTLAHEGYPGHLYQTVYSQSYLNIQDASYIRSLLHYGGFVEGWALYVENISYQYASQLAESDSAAAYMEACRLNRNLLLCLYSYMDIAIHYEGATPKQIESFLKSLGIMQTSSIDSVYEYLVEEPANYLKYYLGYLEFLSLKQQAMELWGNTYSNYKFHQFILETGPSDFTSLNAELRRNI